MIEGDGNQRARVMVALWGYGRRKEMWDGIIDQQSIDSQDKKVQASMLSCAIVAITPIKAFDIIYPLNASSSDSPSVPSSQSSAPRSKTPLRLYP